MRELTQEEIGLAPDWADEYAIDVDGDVHFVNDLRKVACFCGERTPRAYLGFFSELTPIPSKAFDISEHEFSKGSDIEQAEITEEKELLLQLSWQPSALNKDDAIAIAKALGVTGGDL